MTLHFVESAPPGRTSGTPVILLHAFPMDCLLWAAPRKALARAGHHIVTPDLPGFGGSPRSQAVPSLDICADEVAHLMDHMTAERAIIGGLSMGGYVAMAMLRRHPERVAGLILVDTKADADSEAAAANRLAMADAVIASGGQQDYVEGMLAGLLGATTHQRRPQVVATVRRWVLAQDPRAVAWAQQAMAVRPDSHPDLRRYSGPSLVLVGAQDTLSPLPAAASMVEALGARAELVTIADVGHLSAVEDPDAVAAAIGSWLQGRSDAV
jgi:pimeloyl-ACP methyl ester carboxylesterase